MIKAFALLPAPDNAELDDDSSSWHWIHCLELEATQAQFFSRRPYAWIRYAIGILVNAHGHISIDQDPAHVVDYDTFPIPDDVDELYYHYENAQEKGRVFPMDPDLGRRTFTYHTSSTLSTRCVSFHEEILERDRTCVVSDMREHNCEAVNLLPHNKGDEYIENLTRHFSRDDDDIVREIHSPRNGLLLNRVAAGNFGTHVDPNASDEAQKLRCTAHLFPNAHRSDFGDSRLDSGAEVRISAPHTSWPPSILFDLAYAQAVYFDHVRQDEAVVQLDRATARRLKHARDRQQLDLSDMILLFPVLWRPDLWPAILGLENDDDDVNDRINAARHEKAMEKVNEWRAYLATD